MFWKTILLVATTMVTRGIDADELYHLSDEFIAKINAKATTWTAARNFPQNTTAEFIKSLNCAWTNGTALRTSEIDEDMSIELPGEFDARTKWNWCPTLREIRNQGHCGDCWAISVASVISDRQCIQKRVQFHASTEDIASCCHKCGHGCGGGNPSGAFQYYCSVGVVSGGSYGSRDGCKPYSSQIFRGQTPNCVKQCSNSNHGTYQNNLRRGSRPYLLHGEGQMKQDLFINGPITVIFDVYADFMQYRSGVYRHVGGKKMGAHAVKVIGWGVENNTPYWLIANSWGTWWGQRGYVKFLRGSNHCRIERAQVSASMA